MSSGFERENPFFCRFTFGQFFALLILQIVTLFFLFYLGARYGAELLGIAPTVAIQKEKGQVPNPTLPINSDPNVVATTQDPEIKALAKDILQAAPTPELKERVAAMLNAPAQKEPSLPVTEGESLEASGSLYAAPRVEESPPAPTTPPEMKFAVQVGSFASAEEAKGKMVEWKEKGFAAYVMPADIPGRGRWFRVRLGGFESKEKAQIFLKSLQKIEDTDAIVVVNE